MAKRVRLSDIAERLNVSTVTVSKALSGQQGVSDKLREKIIQLAEEMGYVKSLPKQKKKNSFIIGVIVAERYLHENQSFYWQLYQEISQRVILRDCFTMLEVISYDAEKQKEMPKIISENKVSGLIIMGTFKNDYAHFITTEPDIPVLNLNTTAGNDKCDCVVSNDTMGGYRMTNYLFELGHRKIGFVGTRLAASSIDDRYFGYLKALMEHGVEWRDDWVVDDRDRDIGKLDYVNMFRLPEDMPTAFFCNCDITASLLIRKLKEQGYSVPEDISVVGFDNYVIDQFAEVGLTTYEINLKEMAKRAVHIILNKMYNSSYSTGICMVPGEFVERDSARRIESPVSFV